MCITKKKNTCLNHIQVLWVPFDSISGATSELVSADCTGDIALWDICRGRCISWIDSEQAKPINGMMSFLFNCL